MGGLPEPALGLGCADAEERQEQTGALPEGGGLAGGFEDNRLHRVAERISVMAGSDECVITFPVVGGVFGVGRLATKLNELLKAGQIGPWHVGQWIDFKHTAIRIKFLTAADGELATRSWVDAY